MPHLKFTSIICIISLVINSTYSLQINETNSAKQFPKISENQANNSSTNSIQNNAQSINSINSTQAKTDENSSDTKMLILPYPNDGDIPESFKMGFYFFIGLSIVGILFILLKINRMRLSRAERKYGVHGDRYTQELTPLPMATEEDSDNEDHTVFDINRQIRVS